MANSDWKTTQSGLKYRMITEGNGAQAEQGDLVNVHYTGKLSNDSVFDSSHGRGRPLKFQVGVGQVIKGWDEGLLLMREGGKAELVIPPNLAYGNQDLGVIPPDSTLIFEVELLNVQKMKTAEPFDVSGRDTLTTESGLKYIILEEGNGPKAGFGRTVSVHYTGFLENGQKFDSSVERNQVFTFPQGQGKVIKGWDEGVCLVKKGGKIRLIIPPELAYGQRAIGPIPAGSTLVFDVEIVDVQ